MGDEHSPCQKEAILKEMHIEHEKLKAGVTARLAEGELRFTTMDTKLTNILSHSKVASEERAKTNSGLEKLFARLFVDNGARSIQSRINDNEKATQVNAIANKNTSDALKEMKITGRLSAVAVITLVITKIVEHLIP